MTDSLVQISVKKEIKVISNIQGLPSGLLNEGPTDSLFGVKGSLIMIQGFVVLKRLKLLPKY